MSRLNGRSASIHPLMEVLDAVDWQRLRAGLGVPFRRGVAGIAVIPRSLIDAALRDRDLLVELLANPAVAEHPELLEAVTASHSGVLDAHLVDAILMNPVLAQRRELIERLAATGNPELLGSRLFAPGFETHWDLRAHRTFMAAMRDSPAARLAAEQFIRDTGAGHFRMLRSAVVSPIPALVIHALTTMAGRLSTIEQLWAVRSLYDHNGGASGLADMDTAWWRPKVATVVRKAVAADDPVIIDSALATAQSPEGRLEELYDNKLSDSIAELLEIRQPLDWDGLTVAARRKPFAKAATEYLVAQQECPNELRDLLFSKHPAIVIEHAVRLDAGLLARECPTRNRAKATRVLISRELGQGISAQEVLIHARPAVEALAGTLHDADARQSLQTAAKQFRAELSKLVADRLGADLKRWRAARELLKEFPGTVSELLDAAAAAPHIAEDEFPGRTDPYAEPSNAEIAFWTLLDAGTAAAHAVLFPHLNVRTRSDLIRTCGWRSEWVDILLAAEDHASALTLARRRELDADSIDRLIPLSTSGLLRNLLEHPSTTRRQRESWLAPLSPDLEGAINHSSPGHWRATDLLLDTDPVVHAQVSEKIRYILPNANGHIPQLRIFLDEWEAHGPQLIRKLLPLKPLTFMAYETARNTLEELLSKGDDEVALAELRALVTYGETGEAQAHAWRTRTDVGELATENHQWDFDALLAAHRQNPLPDDAVWRLARLEGSPAQFRQEAEKILPTRVHRAFTKLMAGAAVPKVLADNPADGGGRPDGAWLVEAIAAGRVDWSQALRHAHPAEAVLGYLAENDGTERPGHTALAALLRDTTGDSAEAWVLAAHMLPGFPGTVAELLTTAATAA